MEDPSKLTSPEKITLKKTSLISINLYQANVTLVETNQLTYIAYQLNDF